MSHLECSLIFACRLACYKSQSYYAKRKLLRDFASAFDYVWTNLLKSLTSSFIALYNPLKSCASEPYYVRASFLTSLASEFDYVETKHGKSKLSPLHYVRTNVLIVFLISPKVSLTIIIFRHEVDEEICHNITKFGHYSFQVLSMEHH